MSTKQVSITVLCDGLCGIHHIEEKNPLIEAAIYIKVPGLAFHKTIRDTGDIYGNWSVTHIKSGYRIGPLFNTRRRCMDYIRNIQNLIDWTKSEKSVRSNYKKLSDRHKEAIGRGWFI